MMRVDGGRQRQIAGGPPDFLVLQSMRADSGTAGMAEAPDQVDDVAPSIAPPGDRRPESVPMFVLLGFDDTGHADGVSWALDPLRTRVNADGTAARATFFISAGFA